MDSMDGMDPGGRGGADAPVSVSITAGNRAMALALARALVEERLAACANIVEGVSSVYWWRDRMEMAAEAIVILKTRRGRLDALVERARELHDYDCPCIVAHPVVGGNPAFFDWIAAETSETAGG